MSRETVIVFVLCFIAGPLLFALIVQLGRSLALLLAAALGTVMAAVAALVLQADGHAALSLLTLWLAWVLAVSALAIALRRRVAPSGPRRWVTIAGLLATTLPWFGLALARTMLS
ncbi:hypothetical protein GCM10011415_28880 [Salipiger pallidus]|uniref:Uncharacterized protein n=1 Tax=Salipiger pallidus TaxID=1775170 RepID=A0A8J2ZLM9_9RHOB|nr:hypothetical protein [Salipiger pallidus]GGG78147.1 hypothetical protein GCM10011415_28880 [Salipiger pallidus]